MKFLIIFLLMVLNGLFAMAEASLIASRKIRLERLANQGNRRAKIAFKFASDPHKFFSTTQIGITLIGIIAGAYGGTEIAAEVSESLSQYALVAEYADFLGFTLVILFTTYLSLVIGELTPKTIAITHPEAIAMILAPLMQVLYYVTLPFISFLTASNKFVLWVLRIKPKEEAPVTEEELKVIIEQSGKHGILEKQESDMMRSIFRTADRNVNSLMTHRRDIHWIDVNSHQQVILKTIEDTPHTSFPVCNQSLDQVLGMVSIKDILIHLIHSRTFDLKSLIKTPMYIPETMPALELLELFRETGKHVSLVLNEYGSVEGIITLHDVVEAIFGDIPVTEHTYEEAVERDDGSWLIDGMMQHPRWSDLLELHDLTPGETGSYNTLGGFVMHQLGRVPKPADTFEFHDLRFEVVDMDGMRVDKVLVKKLQKKVEE